MTNEKRKEAIGAYRARKDSFDWNGLMDYANSLLECRDRIQETVKQVALDEEVAAKAIKEKVPYLSLKPVQIIPSEFRGHLNELVKEFLQQGIIHDEHNKSLLRSVDLSKLTDKTVELAGEDPNQFFLEAVNELQGEEKNELLQMILAGLLINAVRVYLSSLGVQMTEFVGHPGDLKVSDQPMTCPTCGQPPTLASLGNEGNIAGNSRKLFCACCGTVWPFERVRCAYCGTRNTNKLKYVHSDGDPVHRLYVCEKCGGVLPTVFQEQLGDKIDYDVEQTACGVIQSLYHEEFSKDLEEELK